MDKYEVMVEYARILRQAVCNPLDQECQAAVTVFEWEHEAQLDDFWLRWRIPTGASRR